AQGYAQGIGMIIRTWRLFVQDGNHGAQKQRKGSTVRTYILPKTTGAKASSQGDGSVGDEGHPDHVLAADVKQGERVVHHVLRRVAGHDWQHEPAVAARVAMDDAFGEARGARGVHDRVDVIRPYRL